MGANSSYNPELGGVPEMARTHKDTEQRIDGHKIIVQKIVPQQVQVPMKSNSDSPIYLCARTLKGKEGKYEIASIGIYKDHKIIGQIDLNPNKMGNIRPYSPDGKGMHYHNFSENGGGSMGRKSGDRNNHHPIPPQYQSLVDKIIEYNKKQRE